MLYRVEDGWREHGIPWILELAHELGDPLRRVARRRYGRRELAGYFFGEGLALVLEVAVEIAGRFVPLPAPNFLLGGPDEPEPNPARVRGESSG